MKVKELIKKLQESPENAEVVLAIDEEGNGFHPLYGISHHGNGHQDGYEIELGDDTAPKTARVVCLWP